MAYAQGIQSVTRPSLGSLVQSIEIYAIGLRDAHCPVPPVPPLVTTSGLPWTPNMVPRPRFGRTFNEALNVIDEITARDLRVGDADADSC